ncbi:MAG: hypothetical protein IJH63_00300 [Methanobrevibacter sp.]|nr:hypothetical protein [Methanosphaera sp.]MBR0369144.1 hypothetical protein [Methanobrevibacter sp.]
MVGELLTPVLQKSFSRGERSFYNTLHNGIDNNILYVLSWLKTHEADWLLGFDDEDEFDEAFRVSQLYSELKKRIKSNADNGIGLLPRFYRIGSRVGALDLHKRTDFTNRDQQALNILFDYNTELITNVNVDSCLGIKDILMAGAMGAIAFNKLNESILNSSNVVTRHSGASIRNRCTMIARTEYGRTVNTGLLQCYVNNGVYSVDIVTAGDDRVCDDCIEIERNNPYSIEEAMNLIPVHSNCYDDKTEVFTNHGWKFFKDVDEGDKILSLNPETFETEFLDYVQKIEHKNDYGYMYHIHNMWFDTCVTPDHDCFILQRKQFDGIRDYYPEFRKPYELNSESYFIRQVENNNVSPKNINVNGLEFKTEDYLFFMAWYLSDGNILHNDVTAKKKNYPIKITQITEHTRKIMEPQFKRIADYLGIKLYVGKEYFEFHSKELHDYLKPLGYAHEKYVPKELFKLSRNDLKFFLDTYVLGDGTTSKPQTKNKLGINSKSHKEIITSSLKLIDGLSYIILLAGFYPSVSLSSKAGTVVKHRNGEYASNHDCYVIRINTTRKISVSSCDIDKIEYNGMVYCLELPKYHTLWTRRNGRTCWNGNCRCSIRHDNGSRLDPELTRGWVVNMTNNDYTLNHTYSNPDDIGFTVN